jgi:hypothetical protein
MSEQQPSIQTEHQRSEDEITLKELIFKVREYLLEIVRNWKIVLLITLPILVYLLVVAFITPKKYSAELTFMVNEDESTQLTGAAEVFELLGVGSASTSEYNLDKILELMASKRIIYPCLLTKGEVDGEEDFFANHIIREYKLREEWKREKPKLVDFTFTHDTLANFNRLENTALQLIYKKMLGKKDDPPMLTSFISENSGIMSLTLETLDEMLSKDLLIVIFNRLSQFYINQTTNKQRETYEKVSMETDSIRRVLKGVEYELAKFVDKNQGMIGQRSQVRKEQLERELFVLSTMYGESVKNEEISKFSLKNKTPFVQAIDLPVEPLKVIKKSKSKALLTGLIVGILLSSIFIIGRKIVRDAIH